MAQNGGETVAAAVPEVSPFRVLVDLLRRNLRIVLASTAVCGGATAWYVWTVRPVYEAAATIHVDASRPVTQEFAFIAEMLRAGDVETEMALLGARSLAEAAVDSLALQVVFEKPSSLGRDDVFAEASAGRTTVAERYDFRRDGESSAAQYAITDSEGHEIGRIGPGEALVFNGARIVLAAGELPEAFRIRTLGFREAVEELVQNSSVVRPARDASVMSVSYRGTDRGLVAKVPNLLASQYLERRNQAKRLEADSTVAFLERQIREHGDSLQNAEEARLAFQQGAQVVDLAAEGAAQVRLRADAQAEKRRLEGELTSLSAVLNAIEARESVPSRGPRERSPYRGLAAFATFLENQAVTALLSELNRIETDRTAQLELRTPVHPEVVAMDAQVRQLEGELYQLAVNYRDNLQAQISSADEQLVQFGVQLERIPANTVQLGRLERQVENLSEIYVTLQTRLQQARVAQAVRSGDVRVVDPAIEPSRPIRPRKVRGLALALFFGFLAGTGLAAARDQIDERIRSRQDLVRLTQAPVLAVIPRIAGAKSNGRKNGTLANSRARPLVAGDAALRGSPASEAYRAFRTNVTFLNVDRPLQTVLVTSPGPSEGKSTCAGNLAATLVQQDAEVLLVDADLRRGVIHQMFDRSSEPGLTNVLKGDVGLDEAVRETEVSKGALLHYLPTGTLPPNPSELLGSKHMSSLVETLRGRYEVVLFDSPPLNLVTDAAVLGTLADGVILVARAGITLQGAFEFARGQLEAVGAPLCGVVLNDADGSGRGRYYGGGDYGYYRQYYKTADA